MTFLEIQDTIRGLIAAHPRFAADADITVLKDLGHVKDKIEASLESKGYVVGVWPPTKGHGDDQAAGQTGVYVTTPIRIEVNPEKLKSLRAAKEQNPAAPDPGEWANDLIKSAIAAVLSAEPDDGGVRFELAPDAFDMVDFDEGLLAFHVRFNKLVVLGS